MGYRPYKSYPGEDWGAGTEDSLVSISLETTTAVRGNCCMKVNYYTPPRALTAPDRVTSAPSSLHSNYYLYDDFESGNPVDYQWEEAYGTFIGNLDIFGSDLSEYNILSFYAKSSGSFNFTVWLGNEETGKTSYQFITTPTQNYWKRIDVEIDWAECDSTDVDWMKFRLNGPANCPLWVDDFVFLDRRPETEKETWIDLNLYDYDVSMDGNLINVPTPGYGDVVYSSNPSLQRGVLQYITHAPQDDDDLEFVEQFARRGTQMYLRCAYEGTPIYITENKATSQDTYFGVQRRIQTRFVEDG